MQQITMHGSSVKVVEDTSELPTRFVVKKLYLDFETTSKRSNSASTNPWHTCEILGVAILFDDEELAYYVPVQHATPSRFKNIDYNTVISWLKNILSVTDEWVNHNIKYDYHVYERATGRVPKCRLTDTLSRVKLLPSIEKFNYSLDICAKDFLYKDITVFEQNIHRYLKVGRGKSKDYGIIPAEDMAVYAAVDVYIVRELNDFCDEHIPEDVKYIEQVELDILPIVAQVESAGMPINPEQIYLDYLFIPKRLEEIVKILKFEPHKSADCEWFFMIQHGLPIMGWTESGAASFGEEEILKYSIYLPEECKLILEYKDLYKLFTSFTNTFIREQVNGRLHSDYNMIVRSGRMSCRSPNAQQLSPAAKTYISPPKGKILVNIDFSQIEFRTIVHYINNSACIQSYNSDPNTDFHTWVAEMCGIPRKPAKNINFMLGYGGGKGKCISMLTALPDIIEGLSEDAIQERALTVYNTYHRTLPELKNTAWKASEVMRQRGYIRTFFGRRRYLPLKAHFKSFNSICQGSAADILKIALRNVHEYTSTYANNSSDNIELIGLVHDSFLFLMDKGKEEKHIHEILNIITQRPKFNGIEFRVPLAASVGKSTTNWKECD